MHLANYRIKNCSDYNVIIRIEKGLVRKYVHQRTVGFFDFGQSEAIKKKKKKQFYSINFHL